MTASDRASRAHERDNRAARECTRFTAADGRPWRGVVAHPDRFVWEAYIRPAGEAGPCVGLTGERDGYATREDAEAGLSKLVALAMADRATLVRHTPDPLDARRRLCATVVAAMADAEPWRYDRLAGGDAEPRLVESADGEVSYIAMTVSPIGIPAAVECGPRAGAMTIVERLLAALRQEPTLDWEPLEVVLGRISDHDARATTSMAADLILDLAGDVPARRPRVTSQVVQSER